MAKRTQPIKTATIKLTGDYEGWEFIARTNAPIRAFGEIASGNFDNITKGLAQIMRSWNFVDEGGEELPTPSIESISDLPLDLVTMCAQKFVEEINKLPNS
jgi:hypothetical protein